jgi:hypothetical protein
MKVVIDLGEGFDTKKVDLPTLIRDAMQNFMSKRRDAERWVANGYKGGPPELPPEERAQWLVRKVAEVETRVKVAEEVGRAYFQILGGSIPRGSAGDGSD